MYQEIKADTNATLNLRAAGADGSLLGVPGAFMPAVMWFPLLFVIQLQTDENMQF